MFNVYEFDKRQQEYDHEQKRELVLTKRLQMNRGKFKS